MPGYKKYQKDYKDTHRRKLRWSPEYKKFRVKSPIKTFRDLEVYKQTTQLSARLFQFELPKTIKMRKNLAEETKILYELLKNVPRLILAMERALFNLPVLPDLLLIDGISELRLPIRQICIVRGDQKSLSIASASIVAKVTRDRLMAFYDRLFPEYGFATHKGYGTKAHFRTIEKHGLSPLHRKEWCHVK